MTSLSIWLKKNNSTKEGCSRKRKDWAGVLFLLPSLAGVIIFVLVPFIETVRRSFTNATGKQSVGIENYRSVLSNTAFRLAAENTARFLAVCIPLLLAASLLLALLVWAIRPGGKTFKTTYLLPMAVPVASVVLLWNILFHQNGLINSILISSGARAVDFMGTDAAFWVLIATYLWKNAGYDMVLWLAGLDGINPSYYEAAAVDGANSIQMFFRITLPCLLPTLGLIAVLSLLNAFKVFREAYLVAGNYPEEKIYLLQHLFNNWFSNLDFGRLTAAAVLVAAVLLGVLLLIQKLWSEDE